MHNLPACPQEQTPQSKGSPGIVKDEEALVRYIFPPSRVKANHLMTPDFITCTDLKRGCSFDRSAYCPDVHKQGAAHAKKKGKHYIGYCSVNVGAVRSVATQDEKRAFCVIDDAIEDNAAHALVMFASSNLSKGEARDLREDLLEILTIHRTES